MIVKQLIYLLQSEHYHVFRFLKYVYTHLNWFKLERRQRLDWTSKAKLLFLLSWGIFLLSIYLLYILVSWNLIIFTPFLFFIIPFDIVIALVIISPIDFIFKKRLLNKARVILHKNKPLIIGITGSYGKTSTKEILAHILKKKFSILKTPGNINTDLGIAQLIIDSYKNQQILIIEMGAYQKGDISSICRFIKPDYSIITGVNETHVERFGDVTKTISEKFKLAVATREKVYLNTDDPNILLEYQRRKKDHKYVPISSKKASQIKFLDNFKGLSFLYKDNNFNCQLLASHYIGMIIQVYEIAKVLGMSNQEIIGSVSTLKMINHRLELIYNKNTKIWVIDDSYNGNKDGILSGLKVLSRANGRKLVLTPGLVELGVLSAEIHYKIGRWYAEYADLVLLIKSPATNFLVQGMQSLKFTQYKIYIDANSAHSDLVNMLQKGDAIIFQNDLTDNYL